ncbi:MAG: ribonuclease R [Defluviitaleaceae bacterium]|nr:ribonuclease R [Defluviitaleaceae bacterium]
MSKEYLDQQKEKILGFMNSSEYQPMDRGEVALVLGVPADEAGTLREILEGLVEDGSLVLTKKKKYMTATRAGLISGNFSATQKGFGFVLQGGDVRDIFIPIDATHTALHGDLVLCRITDPSEDKPSPTGEIVKVLQRRKNHFVGTFESTINGGFVTPDDKRLGEPVAVFYKDENGAQDGQKVQVKITQFNEGKPHDGIITMVLGNPLDLGLDVLSLVVEHEIPFIFPDNALAQANKMPQVVTPSETAGRRDFRPLPTVTIDGEDTKDIDDAISLECIEGGFRLYVHIADVSAYVAHGTPLWKEAAKRATSVYLADRVIPMLPPNISNGICSLNPQVDRLALSCVMDFDQSGKVVAHEICKSVIHSDHAVTYTTLADILENPESIHRASYPGFLEMFKDMHALSGKLREKREMRGSLDFDFPESKVIVNAEGKPVDVVRKPRNVATSVIEEFMICANEVVSTEYFWLNIPFVYRVHEEPHQEKIEALMENLSELGISMKKGKNQAKNLQTLLERVKDMPQGPSVSKQILRSLKQARYYPQPLGHFGLASEYYSHFTSPIRRFPDLVIHAIISDNLAGKVDAPYVERLEESLPDICQHSSENERRADACAKEVDQLKKVEFMIDKVGEEFTGTISHTTPSGFFVELENTVEGMVAIASLDGYYEYHEANYTFINQKTKRSFSLGDKVEIVVAAANLELRRLDFTLAK